MSIQKRTMPGLVAGSTYIARVRAYNGLGNSSDWSESIRFNVPSIGGSGTGVTDPTAPSNLVVDYSTATLLLSWTAPVSFIVDHYEIALSANGITVTYTNTSPNFTYGVTSNIADFGSAQGIIGVSIRAVDGAGNKSTALVGTASNVAPPNPVRAPELAASFTIITVSMFTDHVADWGGYYLESSTNGTTFTPLATLIDKDTYIHQVGFEAHYYYRYKIIDKFGNLSVGFSPVSNIATDRALVVDGYNVIDNLNIKGNLVIDSPGILQSVNYVNNVSGYKLTATTGAIFQNNSIQIVSLGGFLSLDSTNGFKAVYSGNTQLLVNSSGVFIGGNDSTSAEIYVDTAAQKTYIQGSTIFSSAGGTYTFTIDLSNQTTGSKVLRLKDGFGTDTFYLTNDGFGYFAKGNINLGGSSALNIDNAGNLWLGHTSFGSAPFSVTAGGALVATSASITGAITATSGTLGTLTVSGTLTMSGGSAKIQTASSGQRIEITNTAANFITFYSNNGESSEAAVQVGSTYLDLIGPGFSSNYVDILMSSTAGQFFVSGTEKGRWTTNGVSALQFSAGAGYQGGFFVNSAGADSASTDWGFGVTHPSSNAYHTTLRYYANAGDDRRGGIYDMSGGGHWVAYGDTNGVWQVPSSSLIKKDIRDLDEGLDKVMALRPVRYYNRWDEDNVNELMGVVAEEVYEVAPQATSDPINNTAQDPMGVNQNALIALLIRAVQQQQDQINDLRQKYDRD